VKFLMFNLEYRESPFVRCSYLMIPSRGDKAAGLAQVRALLARALIFELPHRRHDLD